MFGDNSTRLSITSRGLHQQLIIGIALISIIPILVLWLRWASRREEPEDPRALLVYALVVTTGFTGYFLLRRSADNLVSVRQEIESAVREKGLAQEAEAAECNDILAIRKCTEALVQQLRDQHADLETRRAQVEQHLARATKLESVGAMAAGISHDLDNTFTAILGNTDIILRYAKPDATTAGHIRQIESAANRALEAIRAVRLCTGRGTFTAKEIDISALVRDMSGDLDTSLPPGITITYNPADDAPPVTADPAHLRTVITNLVSNAADAMRNDPGRITVSTGAVQCNRDYLAKAYLDEGLPEGAYVYIEVTDQGPGIPADIQDRVFDPFYSASIRGRGLGLALVMGIVRTHSGAVMLTSAQGKGTTFRILLPTNETRLDLPPEHAARQSIER